MSERNWEQEYSAMFKAAAVSGTAYEEIIAEKNATIARLRTLNGELLAALEPFAQKDLSRKLAGNIEGDESIIFVRGDAELTLGDFRKAAALLASQAATQACEVCGRVDDNHMQDKRHQQAPINTLSGQAKQGEEREG